MKNNYETNVAQGVISADYYESLDVFTCGMGLFAVMCPAGFSNVNQNIVLMEIINLDGMKLGPLLKQYSHLDSKEILEDYCFIASPDMVAMNKADQRWRAGLSDSDGLESMNLKKDARTLQEIESALRCPILQHPQAEKADRKSVV